MCLVARQPGRTQPLSEEGAAVLLCRRRPRRINSGDADADAVFLVQQTIYRSLFPACALALSSVQTHESPLTLATR